MPRSTLASLLAVLVLALALAPAARAQSGAFAIVLGRPEFATSVVAGALANVPPDATSATVTLTLADASTHSLTTSAAQGWQFRFEDVYRNGPWLQLAALASSGDGASLPNQWGAEQRENFVAEHTRPLPQYTYPPDFPGRWYGYYGEAYGTPYAYAYNLPPGYDYRYAYGYGAGYGYFGAPYGYGGGYGYPYGYGYGYPYGYGWYPCR